MAPTIPNPNWPTLFAEGSFGANPYYTSLALPYTDMVPRLYKQWSVRRGKQFELDQVQPGEFHGQWVNQDGALDPTNTGSYYSPGVVPYRGYRMRAQYPASQNILSGDLSTGGETTPLAPGTSGNNYGIQSAYGAFNVTASATAFQGTNVWQFTGTTASTGSDILFIGPTPVQAVFGTAYTFSIRVRSVTTGKNPTLAVGVTWISPSDNGVSTTTSGSTTLTGNPTAPWTTITYTATVPTSAFGLFPVAAQFFLLLSAAPTGTWSLQADGIQVEVGNAASTYSVPGTNYPIFSGLIERYPQSWDYNGTYGMVSPVCVDAMALLSQTVLKEAFVMDLVATTPTWFFQLNEPSGSTTFAEQGGRTPPATVFNSPYGAGTLNPGSSITAGDTVNGTFLGTNGPVVTIDNTGAPSQGGSVIDMTTAGITGAPSSGGWTRMVAFRSTNTAGLPVLAASTSGYFPGSAGYNSDWYLQLQVIFGTSMSVAASMFTDLPTGSPTHAGLVGSVIVNDNNWHLTFFSMSSDGKTLSLYIDGVQYQTVVGTDMHASRAVNDSVGADMYKYSTSVGQGSSVFTFKGDLALYAQWNIEMNATVITNLYNSWKTAWRFETSDQRYGRILSWAGFQGAQVLDAGSTISMGPANDIAGSDALTCLQNVVNTEGGRHFIGADGSAVFQSRSRAFQSLTPLWTFGENTGGGEIPYIDIAFDCDPTRVSNAVSITQVNSGQIFSAYDATSQTSYGVRNLARSNQSLDSEEVRESAYFYLSQYKDPHLRVQTLKVDAASNPTLWSSVLAFEIGQHVRINRRDPFGVRPIITMDGFIEQINHSGDDKGTWQVELQISPTSATPWAAFTALRTTLSATASSGQPVITINALPDAATNPVRSELSDGQLLMISGGGNSEFGTIATGGVQNQAAGYSTATITLTGNLAHTYSSGAAVVENVGSNYDSVAVFNSVQFSY